MDSNANEKSEARCLALGLTDAVPITLSAKYTFEEGEIDLERLHSSLEELLDDDYWPLRGILLSKPLRIKVDGPPPRPYFEVTDRPDLTLSDIRNDATLAHALAHVHLGYGDNILRVRITRLGQNGGQLLLGLNISHAYADAHTLFSLFWAGWAARYSGRPFAHRPLPDRSALLHAPPGAKAAASPHLVPPLSAPLPSSQSSSHELIDQRPEKTPGGCRGIRELLHLTDKDLRSLQVLVGKGGEDPESSCRIPSRQQTICALVWKALGLSRLGFPCNVRENERRYSPLIPFEYAGNAVFVRSCYCPDVKSTPLSELARLVKEAIDSCTAETNAQGVAYLEELAAKKETEEEKGGVDLGEDYMAITSWQHFELCPLFGEAKPRALWTTPEYTRLVLVITDGEEEGLDVHGHLEEVAAIRALLSELLPISEPEL